MSSNPHRMKIGVWPDAELARLFYLDTTSAFEAIYQGSSGTELTIIMTYKDGVEQMYTIPLAHVLMYTVWEEDEEDDSTT